MSDTTTLAPAAGWYPDPTTAAAYRWWNGRAWTADVLDETAASDLQSAATPAADPDATLPSRRSIRDTLDSSAPRRPGVSQGQSTYRPSTPAKAEWQTPDSWAANSPAPVAGADRFGTRPVSPLSPDHAVYGSGVPFVAAAGTSRPHPLAKAINHPARNGFAAGLISILGLAFVTGLTLTEHRPFVVWPIWAVIALVFSLVGLHRAREWEARGLLPVGLRRAVAGVVLAGVALLGQGTQTALALATPQPQSLSQAPASGGSGPAIVPVVGVPQGGGVVYSRNAAQTSIGDAYTAVLKVRPTHVACPATATLAVSESFACTVTLPGGLTTDASVTVVDDQGHVQVEVG